MTDDSIQDLEAAHATNDPTPEPSQPTDDSGDSTGFSLGPSKRTLIILGVVVAALAALYWLRKRTDSDDGDEPNETEAKTTADDFDFDAFEDDEDATDETAGEIVVPQNPNEPLEADRAVIQSLKERGRISGAGS